MNKKKCYKFAKTVLNRQGMDTGPEGVLWCLALGQW